MPKMSKLSSSINLISEKDWQKLVAQAMSLVRLSGFPKSWSNSNQNFKSPCWVKCLASYVVCLKILWSIQIFSDSLLNWYNWKSWNVETHPSRKRSTVGKFISLLTYWNYFIFRNPERTKIFGFKSRTFLVNNFINIQVSQKYWPFWKMF